MAVTGVVITPSLRLALMVAEPSTLATKEPAARAVVMALSVPLSWMPVALGSASLRPRKLPPLALRLRVRV